MNTGLSAGVTSENLFLKLRRRIFFDVQDQQTIFDVYVYIESSDKLEGELLYDCYIIHSDIFTLCIDW